MPTYYRPIINYSWCLITTGLGIVTHWASVTTGAEGCHYWASVVAVAMVGASVSRRSSVVVGRYGSCGASGVVGASVVVGTSR